MARIGVGIAGAFLLAFVLEIYPFLILATGMGMAGGDRTFAVIALLAAGMPVARMGTSLVGLWRLVSATRAGDESQPDGPVFAAVLPETGIRDLDPDALEAAHAALRGNSRAVIPRGMHDAYDQALAASVVLAYERARAGLPSGTGGDFNRAMRENMRRTTEARKNWGPLGNGA